MGVENLQVRGYRWRSVVAFGAIYGVLRQRVAGGRHGHGDLESLLIIAGVVLLFALVGSSERYHLSIVAGVFSGPAPRGRRRAQFRVADIDRARSSKVHLFGGRTIWSRTGEAIYLDPITVPKAGRLEVLRALDLVQAG